MKKNNQRKILAIGRPVFANMPKSEAKAFLTTMLACVLNAYSKKKAEQERQSIEDKKTNNKKSATAVEQNIDPKGCTKNNSDCRKLSNPKTSESSI